MTETRQEEITAAAYTAAIQAVQHAPVDWDAHNMALLWQEAERASAAVRVALKGGVEVMGEYKLKVSQTGWDIVEKRVVGPKSKVNPGETVWTAIKFYANLEQAALGLHAFCLRDNVKADDDLPVILAAIQQATSEVKAAVRAALGAAK